MSTKSESTSKKDQILDAAEELFATKGYIEVTLRQIAKKAGVDIPILNYHFKNKGLLLEGVLKRRADEITADRLYRLDQARKASGNTSPDISSVMKALIDPMVERCVNGGPQWSYYATVLGQVGYTRQFASIIHELYDPVAQHFLSAMRLSLPGASMEKISWGYLFSMYSMITALANTGRIDLMSNKEYSSADIQSACDVLISFVIGGMRGL